MAAYSAISSLSNGAMPVDTMASLSFRSADMGKVRRIPDAFSDLYTLTTCESWVFLIYCDTFRLSLFFVDHKSALHEVLIKLCGGGIHR